MILLLLVILAVLLWLILAELETADDSEELLETACSACRWPVEIDWMVCPHCQQRLRETCTHCHKSKLIGQRYCPFCGAQPRGES